MGPRHLRVCGRGLLALVLSSCGDFDLPRRNVSGTGAADDSWDDPWGTRDSDSDEVGGHLAQLDACEDVAHWERLFAFSLEDGVEVERERLRCLFGVNEAAIAQLGGDGDASVVEGSMAEHRSFAEHSCDLLASAQGDEAEVELVWNTCVGDLELALGRLLGAHADVDETRAPIAAQPWLYPDCDRDQAPEAEAALWASSLCIEASVMERLERVAFEIGLMGVATDDDIELFLQAGHIADTTCAPFEPAPHCAADWLVLFRSTVDRQIER